jgi:hypothetical protein
MNGTLNVVKGGSAIPLQFEAFAGPTELTSTDVVDTFRTFTLPCSGGGTSDATELTSKGANLLRYDSTLGQFILNWATPKASEGCQRVVLTLDDGSTMSGNFRLK